MEPILADFSFLMFRFDHDELKCVNVTDQFYDLANLIKIERVDVVGLQRPCSEITRVESQTQVQQVAFKCQREDYLIIEGLTLVL